MGDITTEDLSLMVDNDNDLVTKEVPQPLDDVHENGSSNSTDVANIIEDMQTNYMNVEESLTNEDILETINDCSEKTINCEPAVDEDPPSKSDADDVQNEKNSEDASSFNGIDKNPTINKISETDASLASESEKLNSTKDLDHNNEEDTIAVSETIPVNSSNDFMDTTDISNNVDNSNEKTLKEESNKNSIVSSEVTENNSMETSDVSATENNQTSSDQNNILELVESTESINNGRREISTEKMELDPIGAAAGILPEQIPSPLKDEELFEKTKFFAPGNPAVQFIKLHCTACNWHLGSSLKNQQLRYIHPLLKVLICKECYNFYTSGDFDKDEDGSELYCRWCGQGGNVLCCSSCEYVFCKKCIRNNLGKRKLETIKQSDDWICFACNPTQIIKHRVTAVALFEYVIEELKRIATLNIPELETNDYTTCCKEKTPVKKRPIDDDFEIKKKSKKKLKTVVKEENCGTEEEPFGLTENWNTLQEEEEVVCAPDLSLLMGGDVSPKSSTTLPPLISIESSTTQANQSLPPLTPIPSYIRVRNVMNLFPENSNSNVGQNKPANRNVSSTIPANTLTTPATGVPGSLSLPPFIRIAPKPQQKRPFLLNRCVTSINENRHPNAPLYTNARVPRFGVQTVTNNPPQPRFVRPPQIRMTPVTSQSPTTNVSYVNNIPAHFLPGLKHEWFDSAENVTTDVHKKLAVTLNNLSKEKNSARSIEDLASVHNKLQEILSSSINTLIQVRRNLRNEFIKGLNQIKANRMQINRVQNIDNDVIIVNSNDTVQPTPSPVINTILSTPSAQTSSFTATSNNKNDKPKTYLKVRTVSQLLNIPSECITLPDVVKQPNPLETINPIVLDDITPVVENITANIEKCVVVSDKENEKKLVDEVEKEPVEELEKESVNEVEKQSVDEVKWPLTLTKEEFEKKMDYITNMNLTKYKYSVDLSVKDLKYMLSAHVHVPDICKVSLLEMLLNKREPESHSAVMQKIVDKDSIENFKQQLTNKLRISRIRRTSKVNQYAIIHSSNSSDCSAGEEDHEWNPCTDSESDKESDKESEKEFGD